MKYTNARLEAKAESIITAITDNTYYPNPSPSLAKGTGKINTYNTVLAAAREGTRIRLSAAY